MDLPKWTASHLRKPLSEQCLFILFAFCNISLGICGGNLRKNKKFWEELIAYFPWYDTGHIENNASNNSSIVSCVFVTAVTFLPSRCLARIGRFLPSRWLTTIRGFLPIRCLAAIRGIYRHTHRRQRDLIVRNKESRLKLILLFLYWFIYQYFIYYFRLYPI
jgi:hypothetical protein